MRRHHLHFGAIARDTHSPPDARMEAVKHGLIVAMRNIAAFVALASYAHGWTPPTKTRVGSPDCCAKRIQIRRSWKAPLSTRFERYRTQNGFPWRNIFAKRLRLDCDSALDVRLLSGTDPPLRMLKPRRIAALGHCPRDREAAPAIWPYSRLEGGTCSDRTRRRL